MSATTMSYTRTNGHNGHVHRTNATTIDEIELSPTILPDNDIYRLSNNSVINDRPRQISISSTHSSMNTNTELFKLQGNKIQSDDNLSIEATTHKYNNIANTLTQSDQYIQNNNTTANNNTSTFINKLKSPMKALQHHQLTNLNNLTQPIHQSTSTYAVALNPDLPDKFDSNVTLNSKFQRFTMHVVTLLVGAVLCLIDASFVISKAVDESLNGNKTIMDLQYAILAFFIIDITLRALALRVLFLKNRLMLIDAAVTFVCLFFSLDIANNVYVNSVLATSFEAARIGIRLWFVWHLGARSARAMVSTNKQRYTLHGFDLDLTYITDRIIAMGLPSTKIEAVYRNPIAQVAKFFNTIHHNHYLLINLCSERAYPVKSFEHRVVRVPFDDHNPPPLATLLHFCVILDQFLQQSAENVVAVHCKGGKGRTGTMIAAWLLYSNHDMYTEQALKYFAMQRTSTDIAGKVQGVGGPSQKRYVQYFEDLRFVGKSRGTMLRDCFDLLAQPVELLSMTFHHVTPVKTKNKFIQFAQKLDDKERDEQRYNWTAAQNWSLLITHYPPRQYTNVADNNDSRGINVEQCNEFYMRRYEDYEEFVFRAKVKNSDESNDYMNESTDAVTFDLTSFYTQSLCLAGDLKFQVFRGNLQLNDNLTTIDSPIDDNNKPYCFCWFWLNTTFLPSTSNQLILRKDQIDEACKNSRIDTEFSMYLQYNNPPKQHKHSNNTVVQGKKYTMKTVQQDEDMDTVSESELEDEEIARPRSLKQIKIQQHETSNDDDDSPI